MDDFKLNMLKGRINPRVVLLAGVVVVSGVVLGTGLFWAKRGLTEHFDILIVGGTVIDGTGAPGENRTLGIRDGKIAHVEWPFFAEADKRIDAIGFVVVPGFIDVHTHIEGNVRGNRKETPLAAPNFIAQGITTIITGNCGTSATSLSQFFGQLETEGTQINVGSLVGHNTIRRQVMGEDSRDPTGDELRRMRQMVVAAMREGALGFSTGLEYSPGAFANQKEVEYLASAAGQYHGLYATHLRDEGNGVVRSLEEALSVARHTGVRLEISHLKVRGRENWGLSERLLDMIAEARGSGVQVRCDVYPYTASSTSLEILVPKKAREGGPAELRRRLKEPIERSRVAAQILEQMKSEGWRDFSFARVAYCQFAPEYNGLTIPEISAILGRRHPLPKVGSGASEDSESTSEARSTKHPKGQRPSGREPVSGKRNVGQNVEAVVSGTTLQCQAETIGYLESRGGAQMIYENMSDVDLANILRAGDWLLGSDSGIRSSGEGRPHPRGYGSAPRLLSKFAIEMKLFSLEEAIRRMTSLAADTFHIVDRGKLLPDYWADIVIFDPSTIEDAATYDDPFESPSGILYVLVNGNLAMQQGQTVSLNSGKVIKREF